MSTRDRCELLLERLIAGLTETCSGCDGTGVRKELVERQAPGTDACAFCGNVRQHREFAYVESPCETCGQTGQVVPGRQSVNVGLALSAACIRQIYDAREGARFDEMNELVDWLYGYFLEGASIGFALAQRDSKWAAKIEEMFRRVATPGQPPQPQPPSTSSALTDTELRDLGLVDDET
jgi:hypothetical protein